MSAYVKQNERGTPLLYFPDGDQEDGVGYREATVAEASFYRQLEEAKAALARAIFALDQYTVSPEDAESMRAWVNEGIKIPSLLEYPQPAPTVSGTEITKQWG